MNEWTNLRKNKAWAEDENVNELVNERKTNK